MKKGLRRTLFTLGLTALLLSPVLGKENTKGLDPSMEIPATATVTSDSTYNNSIAIAKKDKFDSSFNNYFSTNVLFWGHDFGQKGSWQPNVSLNYTSGNGNHSVNTNALVKYDFAKNQLDEVDLGASYSGQFNDLGVSAGGTFFRYDTGTQWDNAGLLYIGANYKDFFANAGVIFGGFEGASASAGHSVTYNLVPEKIAATLTNQVRVNKKGTFGDETNTAYYDGNLNLGFNLSDKISANTTIGWMMPFTDGLQATPYGNMTVTYNLTK